MARDRIVEIEVGSVESTAELHRRLQEALRFPGWYGCNWDAFWDAITDLVEMPETLKLAGWSSLQQRLPRDAEQLQRALSDMVAEYPKQAPRVIYA
jgi:ribonuclease inhibitor